jgi:hypothetical protein
VFFLFLCILTVGLVISFFQKYILRIKEPNVEELWIELEQKQWFKELIQQHEVKKVIEASKNSGILSDPYYVQKIMEQEGHRDGFVLYVYEQANK